jgi:hypothetical protein
VAGEEAEQSAGAGLHALLGQGVAQFAQEEFRPCLIQGEDQIRMCLDRRQAVVAVSRFGRNVTLLRKPL